MATPAPLDCFIITPEQQVLHAPATAVVFPMHDGLVGILKDRAPLLCELGTGVTRVDTVDQGPCEFYVDGGFAQVLNNQVTLLTERSAAADSISRAEAQGALEAAEKMPAKDADAMAQRSRAIRRAKAQLQIARK